MEELIGQNKENEGWHQANCDKNGQKKPHGKSNNMEEEESVSWESDEDEDMAKINTDTFKKENQNKENEGLHQANCDKNGQKEPHGKSNNMEEEKSVSWESDEVEDMAKINNDFFTLHKSNKKFLFMCVLAIIGTFSLLGNIIYSVQKGRNEVRCILATLKSGLIVAFKRGEARQWLQLHRVAKLNRE